MNTQLLAPTQEALQAAARLLEAGQLVAFPTETVYGLGANALDEAAVAAIFSAKGRPADNPLIIHVRDEGDAEALCHLSTEARRLMEFFCPGPLTLLLPKKPQVPSLVNAGLPSVAIRIPAHPVAQALLQATGLPIAAPSANASGRPSPTTAAHVWQDLGGIIPLILDGGPCQVGLESTVLDMTSNPPTVVRPGGITQGMLQKVLPEVVVADSVLRPLASGERPVSPGMMYRHYAPKGELWLVQGEPCRVRERCLALYRQGERAGKVVRILAFQEHIQAYQKEDGGARVLSIGSLEKPETIAQNLFAVLRTLDAQGVQLSLCEVLPPVGMGLAIMNRLSRAASFRVVDANQEV